MLHHASIHSSTRKQKNFHYLFIENRYQHQGSKPRILAYKNHQGRLTLFWVQLYHAWEDLEELLEDLAL